MATRPQKSVERSLCRKGFLKLQGDHHFFTYFTMSGSKSSVFTKTSHTPKIKDLGDDLLKKMAQQCKLSKTDFINLIDCPLSREKYEEKLLSQKVI